MEDAKREIFSGYKITKLLLFVGLYVSKKYNLTKKYLVFMGLTLNNKENLV